MSDHGIKESQVCTSCIGGAAGMAHSMRRQRATGTESGNHIANIFRALQQLQSRECGPLSSSSHHSNSPRLEDGAAAWMCGHLDLLWESLAASVAATPSKDSSVVSAAGVPTHPRTLLILQLLALEAVGREQRRATRPRSLPQHFSVSSPSSPQQALGEAEGSVASVASPTACDASAHLSSSYHGSCLHRSGLPVVHHWLWQRAAALPSASVVADSPYGDLSALMIEWAALTLPAWRESPEEVRWRHESCEALRRSHERASTVATATPPVLGRQAEEARGGGNTVTAAPDELPESIDRTCGVLAMSIDGRPDRTDPAATTPPVKGVGSGDVVSAESVAVKAPLLMLAPGSASPSAPRRVLRLLVRSSASSGTAQRGDVSTLESTAVTPPPMLVHDGEGMLARVTNEELSCAPDADGTLLCTPTLPPPLEPRGIGAATSASMANDGGCGSGATESRSIRLSRSGSKIVPFEADGGATCIAARPLCSAPAKSVHAEVLTRPPMLLCEDETNDGVTARGSNLEAEDSAQIFCAPAVAPPGAVGDTDSRVQWRRNRWRRLASYVLDASPGSEAEQDLCTVLEALGFVTTNGGDCTDSSPLEVTPLSYPERESDDLITVQKATRSYLLHTGAAHATKPPCPLSRLPPLLAAHVWLTNTSLRSSWIAHMIEVRSSATSLDLCDDCSETHLEGEETGAASSPRGSQVPPSSAECGGGMPLIPQLHAECFPQQCIALADHRVFAVLDELLWYTEASGSFLIRFEEKLHEYLCYPLAGVCVPPAPSSTPASATDQSPAQSIHQCTPKGHTATTVHSASAPRSLSLSAWRAYLELRYGRRYLGQSKHLHPPPLRTRPATQAVDSFHVDGQYAEVGDAAAVAHSTADTPHRTEGQDMRKRIVEGEARRTRLSPFAEAALAASSSAKGSTETYAAIMDFAAMVFLAELRRIGATAMAEEVRCATQALREGHSCGGATTWQSVSQRRSGGSYHSAMWDVLQESMTRSPAARVCAYAPPVASSHEEAVRGSSVPGFSLHVLLEGVLESDITLYNYVCRWSLTPSWPCGVVTPNGARDSHRPADAAQFSMLAAASQLWLALVAVLTLGESSTAQYVRGVLMPPASLPAAPLFPFPSKVAATTVATAVAESRPASEASLAPFTMPTLFRSTLEDLYHDETATAAAVSASGKLDSPPCQELSVPPCALGSRPKVENTVSGGSAKSPAEATARLAAPRQGCTGAVTPVTQDTLALCAAVALRHPRVILRQLRFLWHLSSCEGDDVVMTKLSDGSRQPDTPSPSIPASSKTVQMSAAAPRATGTSEHRFPTVRASSDAARSFKEEFYTRVGSLVECMQLASFAGLPPPLAASLIPSGSSVDTSPAEAATVAEMRGASAFAEAHGTTAPSPYKADVTISARPPQQCSTGGGACPPPAPSEDSMGPTMATSTSTDSTASTRLRLKLSLGPSSSKVVTSAISAPKAPSIDGEKRPRERDDIYRGGDTGASELVVLSSASETAGSSARPTKFHCIDGAEKRSMELTRHSCAHVPPQSPLTPPPPPPPPLASLTELRVRWSDEAEVQGGSWRLSLTPSAMTAISGRVQGGSAATSKPLPLLSLVADTLWDVVRHIHAAMPQVVQRGTSDSSGDASTTASDSPATTLVLSATSRGDGKAMPEGPPSHGMLLRLRVSPAYRALQRLWQAISDPAVTERGMAASSITRASTATSWGAAMRCPRLDVIGPSTTSCVPTPAVDLRVYTSLTASLRGTVCVVLGYAVYESLQAMYFNWCSRLTVQHNISALSVNSTVLLGTEQQPSCTSVFPLCESYAWLSGQLRALLENILQPLHRILKVSVLASEKMESAGDSSPLYMVGADSRDSRVAFPLPRDTTRSHRFVTAAWLTYRPIGCVLLPTLLRQLDAAMLQCPHSDCTVTGRSRPCIQAHETWMQVKSELQHAGVKV